MHDMRSPACMSLLKRARWEDFGKKRRRCFGNLFFKWNVCTKIWFLSSDILMWCSPSLGVSHERKLFCVRIIWCQKFVCSPHPQMKTLCSEKKANGIVSCFNWKKRLRRLISWCWCAFCVHFGFCGRRLRAGICNLVDALHWARICIEHRQQNSALRKQFISPYTLSNRLSKREYINTEKFCPLRRVQLVRILFLFQTGFAVELHKKYFRRQVFYTLYSIVKLFIIVFLIFVVRGNKKKERRTYVSFGLRTRKSQRCWVCWEGERRNRKVQHKRKEAIARMCLTDRFNNILDGQEENSRREETRRKPPAFVLMKSSETHT